MAAPSTDDASSLVTAVQPVVRPKPITRFARKPALEREDPEGLVREQVTARAFGLVLDEERIANTTIAAIWGVTESVVRGVRDRKKPLTLAKVQQLPEHLRSALDRKTDELLADLRALRASLPLADESLRSGAPVPGNDHYLARPR